LTGHTGFKGAWAALWLNRLGADVHGVSLPPDTEPALFSAASVAQICASTFCDIRDASTIAAEIKRIDPEIVLHLAAQALVVRGYDAPIDTFATNVMGTANVLNGVRGAGSARAIVVATTDKVYRNLERHIAYREDDMLGGHDPYSASKAACEIVAESFRLSFFENGPAMATARAGNVIGGGDWAADRLIPDAVRAWSAGIPLVIRNPGSVRPWQHVLETIAGYLVLAETLHADPESAGAYNLGPYAHDAMPVSDVIALAREAYGAGEIDAAPPPKGPHEARLLSLDATKARFALGVAPRWSAPEAIRRTMAWYAASARGGDAADLCRADIAAYGLVQ
jgi:CDP-glucose 4,6-dehydratase